MMHDQLTIYLRGVTNAAPNPNAFAADPVLTSRYFSDAWQNYMATYPTAYIIPWGANQRSDMEANNLVKWLFHNGVQVSKATSDFTWNGNTYQAGSYVVWMNQALRGMAWNALSPGSTSRAPRSPPCTPRRPSGATGSAGAPTWWRCRAAMPPSRPRPPSPRAPNTLAGGIVGGVGAPADWYCVTSRACTSTRPSAACSTAASRRRWPRPPSPAPPAAPCRPAR